ETLVDVIVSVQDHVDAVTSEPFPKDVRIAPSVPRQPAVKARASQRMVPDREQAAGGLGVEPPVDPLELRTPRLERQQAVQHDDAPRAERNVVVSPAPRFGSFPKDVEVAEETLGALGLVVVVAGRRHRPRVELAPRGLVASLELLR